MEERKKPEPGAVGRAEMSVGEGDTALAMKSGEIEVFATPVMIALMEEAAVRCLEGCLAPEETSVGVRIDVAHLAATPKGMNVRAEAVLEEVNGRRLVFRVTAFDAKDKIGEGRHERAVVKREKFLAGVYGK